MESSTVKKMGLLPGIAASLFLMAATFDTTNVHATPVNSQSANNMQVAWWYGGGYGHYYHGGYYYHRSGWGPYYGGACQRNCWRNRWGEFRCVTRCY